MGNQISKSSRERIREGARKSAEIQRTRWKEKYYSNPKYCRFCELIIPWDKKCNNFCSSSCSASYNNRKRTPDRNCSVCGKSIRGKDRKAKFCSAKCFQKCRWEFTKEQIKQTGIATTKDGSTAPKRYLLETKGHECEICGRKEWNGQPIPIVLDHINGHPYDWRLKNLRLICSNCDAQTDTYKGKNKGNGREWRRLKYAEGKRY